MVRIQVEHGGRVRGTAHLRGAAQVVAAAQAAALLVAGGKVILDGVSDGARLQSGNAFLRARGIGVDWSPTDRTLKVTPEGALQPVTVPLTRADLLFVGPLLLRQGRVRLALPPTARIVQVLTTLGVTIKPGTNGQTELVAQNLRGAALTLRDRDEELTLALMLTACVVPGITVINQPATGAAVVALARLLNRMGARVHGAGESVIRIEGVTVLHGGDLRVPGDQAQAGRLALLTALTAGDLLIEGAQARPLAPLLTALEAAGNTVIRQENGVRVLGTRVLLATNLDLSAPPMTSLVDATLALALLAFGHGERRLTGIDLEALSPALTVWDRLGLRPVVQRPTVIMRGTVQTPVAGPVTGLTTAAALTWLLVGLRGPAPLAVDLPDMVAGRVVDLLAALTDHGVKVTISAPAVGNQSGIQP